MPYALQCGLSPAFVKCTRTSKLSDKTDDGRTELLPSECVVRFDSQQSCVFVTHMIHTPSSHNVLATFHGDSEPYTYSPLS